MSDYLNRKIDEGVREYQKNERERQIVADRGERLYRAWARWQPHIQPASALRWKGRY